MAYTELAAWGVFGACVHGLAQGLRQKPLNYKPWGFGVSAAVFVGVGIWLNTIRVRQQDFLDRRVAMLIEERRARGVTAVRD